MSIQQHFQRRKRDNILGGNALETFHRILSISQPTHSLDEEMQILLTIPRTTQDQVDLDSTLQTLFPERQALEFLKTVLFCGTVYDGIFEKILSHARDVGCGFYGSATTSVFGVWRFHGILELPRVVALAIEQVRVIVTLVEVLEDGGKDFGFFVGKVDSLTLGREELSSASRREERRHAKDVLVSCEQSTLH